MKHFVFLASLSIALLLFGCYSTQQYVSAEAADEETLMKILFKIPEHGYIVFLQKDGFSYKEVVYSYSIERKGKKFYCRKNKEKSIIDLNNKSRDWLTAEMCRMHDYYNLFIFQYISEDFIELSNDEKLKVLEELSRQ